MVGQWTPTLRLGLPEQAGPVTRLGDEPGHGRADAHEFGDERPPLIAAVPTIGTALSADQRPPLELSADRGR